jgi:hypothetical protein
MRLIALFALLTGCAMTADDDVARASYPVGPYALEAFGVLPDLAGPGIDPARGRMEISVSAVRAGLPECRCLLVHVGVPGSARTLSTRARLYNLRLSDSTMCAVEVVAGANVGDLPPMSEAVAPTMLAPSIVRTTMDAKYPEGFDLAVRTDTMKVRAVTVGSLDLATMREACGKWPRTEGDD